MAWSLSGKWVLITGASSGFGAAAAAAFGAQRCNVLLGARRMDRLAASAERARKAGAMAAHIHELDVTKTASVEAFAAWARQTAGAVDVLVNNAGGAMGLDPVATGRDEDWESMLQSNVLGVLRVTRAILPLMGKSPGGMILNVGSVAGHTAYEGGSAYAGAKAAVLKITEALRLELNGTGIRVAMVNPGLSKTEFSDVRFKGDAARAEKVYEGTEPLAAEDVAEAFVWAASRPPHVNIDEIIIRPVDQAAMHKIFRRKRA